MTDTTRCIDLDSVDLTFEEGSGQVTVDPDILAALT